MVKGVSKRVVVVRPADSALFDEAIFFVKGEAAREGVSSDQIVREACRVADRYTAKQRGKKWPRFRIPAGLYVLFGAAATGLVWFLTTMLWPFKIG